MDKKSFLQILIGILAAIIVFCAIYIPIKTCKGGLGSNSSINDDSAFSDDIFSDNDWDE